MKRFAIILAVVVATCVLATSVSLYIMSVLKRNDVLTNNEAAACQVEELNKDSIELLDTWIDLNNKADVGTLSDFEAELANEIAGSYLCGHMKADQEAVIVDRSGEYLRIELADGTYSLIVKSEGVHK